MQRTLDEKEEMDNVEKFEREQEENAIISYQELLRRAKRFSTNGNQCTC